MLTRVRELYPNITLEYVIHNKKHRVFLTENSEEDVSTNSLFEALTKYRRYFCDVFPGESIHYSHGESLRELYKVISGKEITSIF